MYARFEIGEVSLTVGICDVFGYFFFAIVSRDAALCQYFAEEKRANSGKFRRLAKREKALRIKCDRQLLT